MKKQSKEPAIDKYQWLTDRFVELIEKGVNPWRKEWRSTGVGAVQNFVTKEAYKGANPYILQIDTLCRGEELPYYCGFQQGKDKGWKLIKGSKAAFVTYANRFVDEDSEGNEKVVAFVKWYAVYHVSCWDDSESKHKISDLMPDQQPSLNQDARCAVIDQFIKNTGAAIETQGSQPCYSSHHDQILMPKWEDFSSGQAYYATLLHELTHWTGHETRCNRKLGNRFGSVDYSREELIAEIGSAMLCQHLGINSDLENHASYLSGWLKGAREDKMYLYRSMGQASAAVQFIQSLQA